MKFDLQRFAGEGEGQALAAEDFAGMNAAEQSDVLSKMIRGELTSKPPTDDEQEEQEEVAQAEVEEEKPEPVKRKIKVNGEELELTDEELIAHAQKGLSADKRFEEAAKLRKEAEAERKQIEELRKEAETQVNANQLKLTSQESKQFARMFEEQFGEEYNPFNEDHRDIKTAYQVQKMIANVESQRNQQILEGAKKWAENNPAEMDKLNDSIYALANGDADAKRQMRKLISALDRFENNKETLQDLQMLEDFRTKSATTKPIPKEAIEEQKKIKAEKAGSVQTPKKDPDEIDMERFAKDDDYQRWALGRVVMKKR